MELSQQFTHLDDITLQKISMFTVTVIVTINRTTLKWISRNILGVRGHDQNNQDVFSGGIWRRE
jgi:hypothetical protein